MSVHNPSYLKLGLGLAVSAGVLLLIARSSAASSDPVKETNLGGIQYRVTKLGEGHVRIEILKADNTPHSSLEFDKNGIIRATGATNGVAQIIKDSDALANLGLFRKDEVLLPT